MTVDERPYTPPDHASWDSLPVSVVAIADLIATQHEVTITGLQEAKERPVWVVLHDGRLYLHNGHHRVVRALLRGRTHVYARIAR